MWGPVEQAKVARRQATNAAIHAAKSAPDANTPVEAAQLCLLRTILQEQRLDPEINLNDYPTPVAVKAAFVPAVISVA